VVSDWQLEMFDSDKSILTNLTDVIIQISYTARVGSNEFKNSVKGAIKK
jgi:hypothetical protein